MGLDFSVLGTFLPHFRLWLVSSRNLLKCKFLKNFTYFINLFLAALGVSCCTRAFSSCGERGLLFIAVCGLLIVVASFVVEHRL